MPDFLPRKDADLLHWATNFGNRVSAGPGSYGLTEAQVAEFLAARDAYAAALKVSSKPLTRSPVNIADKDAARWALVETTRRLVHFIRGTPGVTDAQKINLGLPVRARKRGRVPAPTTFPRVCVAEVRGRTVHLRLQDSESSRRGKPSGVAGAMVYSYVGPTPPKNAADWRLARNTTTPRCAVEFDAALPPGTQVWLVACWYSPTAECGPFGKTTYTHLSYAGPRFQLSLAA